MEDKLEEIHFADQVFSLANTSENSLQGRIFLGGKEAAQDLTFLKINNIKAVLTMTSTAGIEYVEQQGISHLIIDAEDTTTYDISKDFLPTFTFIDENLLNSNILVHCEKGISRSPAIVIAYIMRKERKAFSQALALVRSLRQEISPNGKFLVDLDKLQRQLRKEYNQEVKIQYQQIPYQSRSPFGFYRSRPTPQNVD